MTRPSSLPVILVGLATSNFLYQAATSQNWAFAVGVTFFQAGALFAVYVSRKMAEAT